MAKNNNSGRRPERQQNTRKARTKKRKKAPIKIMLLVILGFFLLSSIGVGAYTVNAVMDTPDWNPGILYNQKESSIVYDKNGDKIAQLHHTENRLLVEYKDIPQLVKDTFIAVEDKRFEEHHGVDPLRIAKAAWNNLKAGGVVEGGSTITIQLAKNAFIENPTEKKLDRKIKELVLALNIERTYTKEEILTFYLNRIFFGESSFGIRTAAQTYFGKELNELNPAEVALLAGLPQAPSTYDPYLNPEAAKKRRNIVLSIMRDNGIITEEEYDKYKEEPFSYVEKVLNSEAEVSYDTKPTDLYKKYPYFVDYVINQLQEQHGFTPEQIYGGGLRIYTSVDPKIQEEAEKAFASDSNFPKSKDEIPVQGAMVVLEPETGAVAAMVGGREYTPMGLNRAWQAQRFPGSTAKPLTVYAPALEKGGYYPGTVFDDMPVEYKGGNGKVWAPVDYDTQTSGWKGLITMRYAVKWSVNVYAVKLLEDMGINYGWEFAKERLGLPLQESNKVLSLALGTAKVSPLDMASAYSTFPANGIKTEPFGVTKVTNSEGDLLLETKVSKERVMKETTAYQMNDLLRTVVTSGTGTNAVRGSDVLRNWYICGKTGTTSLDKETFGWRTGNKDAWFAGYSPKYTGIVWMGYDKTDPDHYLYQVYGGSYPAQIWKQVMTAAHEDLPVQSSISRPSGITTVEFDTKSGLLPSSLTPEQFISTEICATDSIPTSVSDVWVERYVSKNNPELLLPEGDTNGIKKVFLDVEREEDLEWPEDEKPYKMPTEYAETSGDDPNDPGATATPPLGDLSLPQITLGDPDYNPDTTNVVLPIMTNYDSSKYTLLLYIKRPERAYLETFVPEDGRTQSISYFLNTSGQVAPGKYGFWSALMDNETFSVGPPSNPAILELESKDKEDQNENNFKKHSNQ